MIAAIEGMSARVYVQPMRCAVLHLLALVAMLLMPLQMSATPAAQHQERAATTMPMQHCPDSGQKPHSNGATGECTAACSAALPAAFLSDEQPPRIAASPVLPKARPVLAGLHPETATPPPKLS